MDLPESTHRQIRTFQHNETAEHYSYRRLVGSIVLGLNDAPVELTGALAGLTLALQNVNPIALSGPITGTAAAMSIAASEYLSTRSEQTDKHPDRAAHHTGAVLPRDGRPFLLHSRLLLCDRLFHPRLAGNLIIARPSHCPVA